MKKRLVLCALLVCCACLAPAQQPPASGPLAGSSAAAPGDAVPYRPAMLDYSFIHATCREVSGLCLAPAGDGLLAASDQNGVFHVAWDGTTTPFYTGRWIDCEGVTIDPATKDVYYVVERKQEVRRLAAPDYKEPELLGVISEAGLGSNDGLEGITWFRDGTLLVGNQWKPVLLMRFSPGDGVLSRRELAITTEIADLCYDPVRDVLWMTDSESHLLRLCTPDGEQLATYPIPFVDNGEGVCVDHAHGCIWVGDDTTSKVYQIRFEGL